VLKSLPEVPISITGHDHRGMSAAMHQGDRLALRIKAYTEELGRLDLQVDVEKKTVVSWDWKRIPIAAGGPVAPDVEREVKRWEAEAAKLVDTPIGESRQHMKKREVKALFERAMAEEMHTDFAFVNNGGLRDDLPAGRLLARHIWNIMPFDNIVVVAKVKGSQLPETVTHGRPVDADRIYTLASTDFTAANQGAPGELGTSGLSFSTDGPLLRDVLIEWIRKQNVVGDN
jgi:2',3'-cyclic-nucleotide 2'-phosphodiesterase (5'-nucleotidase family)